MGQVFSCFKIKPHRAGVRSPPSVRRTVDPAELRRPETRRYSKEPSSISTRDAVEAIGEDDISSEGSILEHSDGSLCVPRYELPTIIPPDVVTHIDDCFEEEDVPSQVRRTAVYQDRIVTERDHRPTRSAVDRSSSGQREVERVVRRLVDYADEHERDMESPTADPLDSNEGHPIDVNGNGGHPVHASGNAGRPVHANSNAGRPVHANGDVGNLVNVNGAGRLSIETSPAVGNESVEVLMDSLGSLEGRTLGDDSGDSRSWEADKIAANSEDRAYDGFKDNDSSDLSSALHVSHTLSVRQGIELFENFPGNGTRREMLDVDHLRAEMFADADREKSGAEELSIEKVVRRDNDGKHASDRSPRDIVDFAKSS